MITIKLEGSIGRVQNADPLILSQISDQCSFDVQGAEKSELYRKKRWDGKKRLFNKQHGKFPIGLLHRITAFLESQNLQYEIMSKPIELNTFEVGLSDLVEKRPYQIEAVSAAIKTKNSVIQVATGGGKTVIAAMLVAELKCNTLFMVHTKDLLYQAKKSFEEFLQIPVGQIGDGIVDIQPVTCATMQTISKYLGVKVDKNPYDDAVNDEKETDISGQNAAAIERVVKDAQLVIWDEVHRVACDMAHGVSEAIKKAPYRVGLSASPWRDDGADMMIEAAMGHVSYKVSASDLMDMGYLVKPIIRRVKVPALIPWYADHRTYDQIYKQEIVENSKRNHMIMNFVRDFVGMGMPTMVLVQQIKHGNTLKKMISENFDPIDFLSGRDFSQKRNQTIQEMRDGDRYSLIASTIADEGLDIKRLTAIILAGGGKSSTRALQRIGRVLRPFEGKTHAIVIDFDDEAKYLRDHATKRRDIYQTEHNFTILEI
jgi:superfamily II DNA or RNA helicase